MTYYGDQYWAVTVGAACQAVLAPFSSRLQVNVANSLSPYTTYSKPIDYSFS